MNKLTWSLHGDYEISEIEEELKDRYPNLTSDIISKLALNIYNLCYNFIINIEFDENGQIKVKV